MNVDEARNDCPHPKVYGLYTGVCARRFATNRENSISSNSDSHRNRIVVINGQNLSVR
jgi:hypothetical protein